MNSKTFKDVGDRLYSKVLYTNVLSAVKLFFFKEYGRSILDICSGPGLLAKEITKNTIASVTCVDSNPDFIKEISNNYEVGNWIHGDVLKCILPNIKQGIFINASGYFNPNQLKILLKRLPCMKLIANFFIEEDQKWKSPQFIRKRKNLFTYDLGPEKLILEALSENTLNNILKNSGWEIKYQFYYADFKFERLLLLERI